MKRLAVNFEAYLSMKGSSDFKYEVFFFFLYKNNVNSLNPLSWINSAFALIAVIPRLELFDTHEWKTIIRGNTVQVWKEWEKKNDDQKELVQNKNTPGGSAALLGDETCHAGFTRSDFNASTAESPNYHGFVL